MRVDLVLVVEMVANDAAGRLRIAREWLTLLSAIEGVVAKWATAATTLEGGTIGSRLSGIGPLTVS